MNKIWQEFKEYLLQEVNNHSIYVWGAQGQKSPTITSSWIRNMETSESNAARATYYWQKQVKAGYGDVLRAFDCSGLIMYFFENLKGMYKDMTAHGIYNKSKAKEKSALIEGDFVFYHNGEKVTHVGVYMGDGTVIEAKGRDDGVCRTKLNEWKWNRFGRFEGIAKYDDTSPPAKEESVYVVNERVRSLQKAFNADYNAKLDEDGKFGPQTKEWVEKKILNDINAGVPKSKRKPYPKLKHAGLFQRWAKEAGYAVGNTGIDEKYGANSAAAILKLQKDQNMKYKDGKVGPEVTAYFLGKTHKLGV